MKLKGWQVLAGVAVASVGAPAALYFTLAPTMLRQNERVVMDLGRFGYAEDGRGLSIADEPLLKKELAGLDADDRVLVVAMGDCSQCTANSYHPGDEDKAKYQRVIILLNGEIEKTKPKVDDTSRYRYVTLPNGDFLMKMRAIIRPRLYVADGKGVISNAETSMDDRQEVLGK